MATFVQGVAPLSPKPVVFDLDFNYMERMLKMRQNMYNQGAAKVKNLYDSLFTSNMMRDDNIAKRDAYLKTISDSLKGVGGLDFSMGQNVQNATNYFQPILNDKYIPKDITYTKNYSTELSKADGYRTSSNGEEAKKYWEEGVKYLQYKAEEFKNASKEEALGMAAPKYVPNVDMLGMADKLYKDGKISVKQDIVNGGYIWTMKNGDLAYPITQTLVSTMFAQNPAIKEALKARAYVTRKDWVKNNAAKFGGDEIKAEEAYMETVITNVVNKNRLELYADDEEVNKLANEVASWEKVIKEGKLLQGSDDEKKYRAAVDKLKVASDLLVQKKIDMTAQELNDLGDVNAMRSAVDSAVTMSSYNTLSYQIAKHLADKNKEIGIKVDPYAMSDHRYKQNVSLKEMQAEINRQMEEIRQTNRETMEDIRQGNRLEAIQQRENDRRTRPTTTKKTTTTTGKTPVVPPITNTGQSEGTAKPQKPADRSPE